MKLFIYHHYEAKTKNMSEKQNEIMKLKKEIEEYEAIETYIMEMIKKGCKYEDLLKAHYREGKIINGKWVDNSDNDDE